jgi:hypothetical protein
MKETNMTEADLKMLTDYFDRLRIECNTPEKARAQLQKEGLLDEDGLLPARYGGPGKDPAWR